LIRMVLLIMPPPKLLDQVRSVVRKKHFSLRTEQAYLSWIKRFIIFNNKRHPAEMGEPEIRDFLSDLAVKRRVAASTQTVALSAILFLYREVLKQDLPYISDIERAKSPVRLPVVFTRTEAQSILARLSGNYYLLACLLYGAGLRLMEAVTLRVKDVDFESNQLTVRAGKGATDRVTMLPQSLKPLLQNHLIRVRLLHNEDLNQGFDRRPVVAGTFGLE
ncbi:MAG: phage integrase N-terminal SAM-like domain-containing protein, partial [Pyrinomonadaceae bacterium]